MTARPVPDPTAADAAQITEVRTSSHEADRAGLQRMMAGAVTGFIALTLVVMLVRGLWLSPDLAAVLVGAVALLLGRGRLFLRDWLPFVAIFLAWQSMRGLADDVGLTVHSDSVQAIERVLFLGHVPAEVLQQLLYRHDAVTPIDVGASLLYMGHFGFPVVLAFYFWLRDRAVYYRFVGALLLMAIAGFVIYILLPVAPPRFADIYGQPLAVVDVMRATLDKLQFQPFMSTLYAELPGNPVAAFPSLHFAFPVLGFMFVRRERIPRLLVLIYAAAILFAIVYLGHHYVVDAVGGALLAVAAYFAIRRLRLLKRAGGRLDPPSEGSPS